MSNQGASTTPQPPASTGKAQLTTAENRATGKQTVNEEALFERYRGPLGMTLSRFLKLFRDAVLLDNSWTLAQAVSSFFHISEQSEWGHDGGTKDGRPVRLLTLEGFTVALKRFSRLSSAVATEVGRGGLGDQSDLDYTRWEALKRVIGERLQATPKSDDDALLVNVILSEHIQLICLQNEFRLRRIFKRLLQADAWEHVVVGGLRYAKADLQQFIRNFISKDYGGPLRQEDLGSVIRHGNHENSAKEHGARDTSSGDASFPEFMEMTMRVALGSIQLTFPSEDGSAPIQYHGFDLDRDPIEYAAERIQAVWRILWDWLDMEVEKEAAAGEAPEEPLMEECAAYDDTFTDVAMLFAHYGAGLDYSSAMDFSDPFLRIEAKDVFRMCRDGSVLDDTVTFSSVAQAYREALGPDDDGEGWMGVRLDFVQWQKVMVKLARCKYRDSPPLQSVALLLRKWLLPMVYVEVPKTELTDFIFSPPILSLFLTYEAHVLRTIEEDGEETLKDIEDPWPDDKSLSQSSASAKRDSIQGLPEQQQQALFALDEFESMRKKTIQKTIKIITLIDFVAFLKALSFLSDLITVDEVPDIFDSVLNAIPAHQTPINEGGLFVPQLMIALLQIALLAFSRPPYATKFATREEKLLTTIERVEVAYFSLFGHFMPLTPPATFPAMDLRLHDLTQENELRDFLLTRRLQPAALTLCGQRGVPLVAVGSHKAPHGDDEAAAEGGKLGQRKYVPVPETQDGHRPPSLGIPCLIREQLFAPEAPHPVGALMETALIHHNAARYKAAAETYLQALHTWAEMIAEEDKDVSFAPDDAAPDASAPAAAGGVPAGLYLYFFVALGGVYESATLQELALACYCEGRVVGDTLEGTPEAALAYGAIGGSLFHLGQYGVALAFFEEALRVREATLGEVHMDCGLLYNNIGACYDMLHRVTEAIESFQRARDVFQFQFGMSHPRTATVMRNLSRVKNRKFDFTVSFAERKPTACPPSLLGKPKKTGKKGKKGAKGKKGGKKKK